MPCRGAGLRACVSLSISARSSTIHIIRRPSIHRPIDSDIPHIFRSPRRFIHFSPGASPELCRFPLGSLQSNVERYQTPTVAPESRGNPHLTGLDPRRLFAFQRSTNDPLEAYDLVILEQTD
ncbi:hypothetical protein ASPVEDRAFT_596086 [Aspergillus versicolor CBS 583.65]|uniref:Uncharacterized protein n=1 Tax=Aspergillus versicolor CBS 583.65 TaxID=1036611 RepID=A0A1L9PHD8_ASPVE|nr:uncharacterized protein ASPVEDRAFT_596086 [Aspergillus versicolor CBS 583.65]OJJ00947.1 hypothetical protein ASPVEDRAFT_596086 [Aspergillus versicolor CBS 583.65]